MRPAESVQVATKGRTACGIMWRIPILMAGNEVPAWTDAASSVQRRLLIFQFSKMVLESDSTLKERLKREMGTLIKKINVAYLEAAGHHGSKDLWNHSPKYFRDRRAEVAMDTNALRKFLHVNTGAGGDCAREVLPGRHLQQPLQRLLPRQHLQHQVQPPHQRLPGPAVCTVWHHLCVRGAHRPRRRAGCRSRDKAVVDWCGVAQLARHSVCIASSVGKLFHSRTCADHIFFLEHTIADVRMEFTGPLKLDQTTNIFYDNGRQNQVEYESQQPLRFVMADRFPAGCPATRDDMDLLSASALPSAPRAWTWTLNCALSSSHAHAILQQDKHHAGRNGSVSGGRRASRRQQHHAGHRLERGAHHTHGGNPCNHEQDQPVQLVHRRQRQIHVRPAGASGADQRVPRAHSDHAASQRARVERERLNCFTYLALQDLHMQPRPSVAYFSRLNSVSIFVRPHFLHSFDGDHVGVGVCLRPQLPPGL